MVMDLSQRLGNPAQVDASLSALARGVVGSEILRIAAEIRALKAKGATICNLTVGDFDPAQFPVPASLLEGVRAALAAGHTNYPPSDGVLALREAVARYYERGLGLKYPGRVGAHHRRRAAAALRHVPHGARPRRPGRLPGAVVEQQPLRVSVRRARRRAAGHAPSTTSSRRRSSCARC